MKQMSLKSPTQNPVISVILTSYNHAPFLPFSIESILNQSYRFFELIIIDDNSSDDSWEIIQTFAKKDSRIRAYKKDINVNDQNLFIPSLYSELKGDFIAIAHSDDAWAVDKLKKQLDYLQRNQNVAACFTWVSLIDDNDKLLENSKHFFATAFNHKNRSRFEWLHYFFFEGCPLCHPSLLIRKEAYFQYNLFTSGLNSVPDFCKWIRLCLHADLHVIEEKLTYFRAHTDETNTSGDSYVNRCRTTLEDYFILHEFKAIADPDTFLKVFPEARKYHTENELIIPFALAQMALSGSWKTHKLFGLETIYNLFQNEEIKERISTLYNYNEKSFLKDKSKYDIFGSIPSNQCAHGHLFVRYSDNAELDSYPQDYYISSLGFGSVSWDLTPIFKKGCPKSIVFLADTQCARKIRLIDSTIDSSPALLEASSESHREDDWDVFFSPLPQYHLHTIDQPGSLLIYLQTEPIRSIEVHEHICALEQDHVRLNELRATSYWKILRLVKRFLRKITWRS